MILGGLALVFSRLIDNGVIVLENIFRHMEMGETPLRGGGERRQRSLDGRARRHIHHFHRVLPGHVFPRRQQVHLHAAGAGRGALDLRLVLLRHDGGAALLRQVHQHARRRAATHEDAKPGFFRRFERWFNAKVPGHAQLVRRLGPAGHGAPGSYRSADLSAALSLLLAG